MFAPSHTHTYRDACKEHNIRRVNGFFSSFLVSVSIAFSPSLPTNKLKSPFDDSNSIIHSMYAYGIIIITTRFGFLYSDDFACNPPECVWIPWHTEYSNQTKLTHSVCSLFAEKLFCCDSSKTTRTGIRSGTMLNCYNFPFISILCSMKYASQLRSFVLLLLHTHSTLSTIQFPEQGDHHFVAQFVYYERIIIIGHLWLNGPSIVLTLTLTSHSIRHSHKNWSTSALCAPLPPPRWSNRVLIRTHNIKKNSFQLFVHGRFNVFRFTR